MKTIVLYYSFGGHTKAEAARLASERDAELIGLVETKKRRLLSAFFPGAYHAKTRKASEIQSLTADLTQYDRIIIGSPIWGGFPTPAFNAIVDLLPAGKEVELFFCSAGGSSKDSEEGTRRMIQDRGCTLVEYRDIKAKKDK